MKIADLKEGMKDIDLVGMIAKKGGPQTRGGKPYCRAILSDGSAHIVLNLWRNQVNQVQEGNKVRVPKAFVHKWGGEIQLSTWSDLIVLE